MALIRWNDRSLNDSWSTMRTLQDEINRLFDLDVYPASNGLFDRSASPAMDVVEGENAYTLTCELPGVEQKNLEVTVAANVLTLKGEKKDVREEKGKYYRKEIVAGSFQRTFSLPEGVDSAKIEAQLEDGILTLTLPKKEEIKPKLISVSVK